MVLVKTWQKLPPRVQDRLVRLNRSFSRVKGRTAGFDRRTGILTVAIPFTLLMLTTVVTGTQVIDKQFELRLIRRQCVSLREHQHEEQRNQYLQFLSQTESWEDVSVENLVLCNRRRNVEVLHLLARFLTSSTYIKQQITFEEYTHSDVESRPFKRYVCRQNLLEITEMLQNKQTFRCDHNGVIWIRYSLWIKIERDGHEDVKT